MNDELDRLSDSELNELFAVEVAGWSRNAVTQKPDGHPWLQTPPKFTTDANSVLPFLEKHPGPVNMDFDRDARTTEERYQVYLHNTHTIHPEETMRCGNGSTFARAAVIALLRQARLHEARAKQEAALPPVYLKDLKGIAPNATGDLSSVDFVRKLRDEWQDREHP